MITIQAAKEGLKALLSGVEGVSKAETKVGGQEPWSKAARALQSYWVIHLQGRKEDDAGLGGYVEQTNAFKLQAWMPFSYQLPDSTEAWDALLDRVCDALRAHRSLYRQTSDVGLPQITTNDYEAFSGQDKEIVCHHAVIEVALMDEGGYRTE